MKKVYNNIIPLKGYKAITLWPWAFIRKGATYTDIDDRHETIHGCQQKEMLVIAAVVSIVLLLLGCGWWSLLAMPLFFWWYAIEWLIKLCYYRNATTAYKNVSFEREAYCYQHSDNYVENRGHYAWVKFINIKY